MTKPTRRVVAEGINDAIFEAPSDEIRRMVQNGLEQYPTSLLVADACISALDAIGDVADALALAVQASRRRIRRISRTIEPREPRVLDVQGRIFLSGYFYSGSGAVLDFLKDFDGVGKWSPAGEMRLIKFPGGTADQIRRFKASGGLTDQDLLDFYLHVVGAKATPAPKGHYSRWGKVNTHSQKLLESPAAAGYLARCLECFNWMVRKVGQGALTQRSLAGRFRRSTQAALDSAATAMGVDCLLIDQAINAWRLSISKYAPPSTFIVVHRDPRDQFVDASVAWSAPGRTGMSATQFIDNYRARRLSGEKMMTRIREKYGHEVVSFAFEDFLMDHDRVVADLLPRIGFDKRAIINKRYDIEASRANMGKYREALSEQDARIIAEGLPEYLSPHLA